MRPSQILASVFALSSVTVAWPWPENIKAPAQVENAIYARQNNKGDKNNNPDTTPKPPASPKSTAGSSKSTSTTAGKGDSKKGSSTSSGKGSDPTDAGSKTTGKPESTTHTFPSGKTFGPSVPPGGVSILTPAAISGPQYFKIGDYVTFGWNYTSLKVTPTKIDVLATCTLNQATYTIAGNQSVQESGLAVWDTKKDISGSAPLLMATYTLIIKDADQAITAIPKFGYLSSYHQYMFAMYSPEAYTPLSEFQCATCQVSAGSITTREALTLLFGTAALTILSFGYFASSFFSLF